MTYILKSCTSSYISGKCDGKYISWCSKLKKDQEKNESSVTSTGNVVVHVGILKRTLLQTPKEKVAGISAGSTWMIIPTNTIWHRMSTCLFDGKLTKASKTGDSKVIKKEAVPAASSSVLMGLGWLLLIYRRKFF